MSFYKSTSWKHKRAKVLRRDEYLCQECKRYGRSTPAVTVHHIIPLAWCMIHNLCLSLASVNLVSLCDKCHNKMHDRDADKLTALGLQWVKRMGEAGLYWLEKYGSGWQR